MERYEKGEQLGEGQFGVVFKAKNKQTGKVVAIKKVRLGKAREGVNVTALREIKLLRELRSPHLVRLLDVFPHKRNLLLVFECMEGDLEGVINDRASIVLGPADVKAYMRMVIQSVAACHAAWVVHRDIKPNNFLIAASGELKLADFGLARIYGSPDRKYTSQVFARWYRAPELLFGSSCYSSSIDMWAVGCLFAELLLRRPWFPGTSDIDQLSKIFHVLGTPSEDTWRGVSSLPQYMQFEATQAKDLRQVFRGASEDALDLLSRMVALDPRRRISAVDALRHRYFTLDPQPTPPEKLPKLAASHKRQQEAAAAAAEAVAAAGATADVGGKQQQSGEGDGAELPPPAKRQRQGGGEGASDSIDAEEDGGDLGAAAKRRRLSNGQHQQQGVGSAGGGNGAAHVTPLDKMDMPIGGSFSFRDQVLDSSDRGSLRGKLDMDSLAS